MSGSPAVWEPRTIRSIGLLFDGDTLCQVAGLVDVSASEHRGMVGKELDWNCVQQRGDERVAVGHGDVEGEAVGKPRIPAVSEIITTRPPRAMTSSTLPRV